MVSNSCILWWKCRHYTSEHELAGSQCRVYLALPLSLLIGSIIAPNSMRYVQVSTEYYGGNCRVPLAANYPLLACTRYEGHLNFSYPAKLRAMLLYSSVETRLTMQR
jgi:hypothetical protein